eukprot:3085876-Amphidinium_carterae.2
MDIEDVPQRPAMGRKKWCQLTHRPTSRVAIPLVCIDLPTVAPCSSFPACGEATAHTGTTGSQRQKKYIF